MGLLEIYEVHARSRLTDCKKGFVVWMGQEEQSGIILKKNTQSLQVGLEKEEVCKRVQHISLRSWLLEAYQK